MAVVAAQQQDAIFGLVDHLASVSFDALPPAAIEMAKLDILDTLGVSIAGRSAAISAKVVDLVTDTGGREEATIIGGGNRVPAQQAAFANATLAHALNFDDYSDPLITHFGCIIFPAAVAAAERAGNVDGRSFITAYAASLDFATRLSRAILTEGDQRNWNLYGWLTTQMVGYFGAAAAAGMLLGFDRDTLLNALGLAYSQVAGNKQALIGAGADKGVYPSYAAHGGVLAALMAEKGLAGPKEILEGRNGFYNVFFQGAYDRRALTRDVGTRFEGVGFYAYPCCGFTHSRIELARCMVDEHGIAPDDIARITVFVGPISRLLCEPIDVRRSPRSTGEAQYSLPFTIATAIVHGQPKIEHFTLQGIKDEATLRVSNRVEYRLDPECDLQYGTGYCPAKLEIELTDGRRLYAEQFGGRYGHPERPIGKAELVEKFRDCARHSITPLSDDKVEGLLEGLDNLEAVPDVAALIRQSS